MKSALTNVLSALHHPLPLPVEKAVWCKPRSSNWWENIVVNSFTDQDWLKNFRMKKTTFLFICEQLQPYLQKQDSNMRKSIPVHKRVAVALWGLATGSYYNTIGHLFGISEASVCQICDQVCSLVASKMLPRFIQFPDSAELDEVISDFEKRWGFPQCAAAIDGSHIPIKTFGDVFDGELTKGVDGSAERICNAEPSQTNAVHMNAETIRNALVKYCQDHHV
eukprot:gene21008-23060_t